MTSLRFAAYHKLIPPTLAFCTINMKFVFLLFVLISVASSVQLKVPLIRTAPLKLSTIRAGQKRPSLKTMFKAFWLTLVDPRNEESLKHDVEKRKKDSKILRGRKGRSLKD